MGWNFKWVSSFASDFNYDFHVSFNGPELEEGRVLYNFEWRGLPFKSEELAGLSVFYRDLAGDVFHTYSTYSRGDEPALTAYAYLDITPKGRDENGPTYTLADWVRHHDRYDAGGRVAPNGRYIPAEP